jgi:gliding motility-associated lipoprotein GldH
MKKGLKYILLVFAAILIFAACDRKSLINEYKIISKNGWNKDSLMVFEVPVADTVKMHQVFVNVRNDIEYKYSNLWLFIGITQPGDTIPVTDTLEITLADPTGKWLGEGFGGMKTTETLYRKNVYFPKIGNYKIDVQHGMRGKILTGITDVGIRVERQ